MAARSGRPRLGTFELSLGIAFVAHLAALATIRFVPHRPQPGQALEPRTFVDVSVLLPPESAALPEHFSDVPAPLDGTGEGQGRALATAGAVAHLEWPTQKSIEGTEATPETAEPAPQPSARVGPGPTLSLNQLGVGGPNQFLGDRPAPSSKGSAESRLEDSMRAEIVASDADVGLTRGGAVADAIRSATSVVDSPRNGTAVFLARTDAAGLVVVLEPTSVSSNFSAWQNVAKRALYSLRNKRLRVPQGAQGLSIGLEVRSHVQLPSGHDPGLAVNALGIPLKKGDGKNSSRIDILKPDLGVDMVENPTSSSDDPQKLPRLRAGINVFALGADPMDIGAQPRRILHVRVLSERPL